MVAEIVFRTWVQTTSLRIDCDNHSAIFLAKNLAYHSRMKHVDVQYHFVRDMVESMKVLLERLTLWKMLQIH